MFDPTPETFTARIVGETTGEEYVGVFKVKPVLHQSDQLTRDAIMRDLLGNNPQAASANATTRALILAEIQVRSIEVPAFWKESKNGMALFDENVLGHLYDKIQEVEKNWRAEVKKKADAARAELEKASIGPK